MMKDSSMRSENVSSLLRLAAIALCMVFPVRLWAGAAYVYEMANPAEVGTAGVGLEVKAQNAGTVFANAAGMMRFNQPEMLVAGTGM
jgi:long-subunit fatty acid transport protein